MKQKSIGQKLLLIGDASLIFSGVIYFVLGAFLDQRSGLGLLGFNTSYAVAFGIIFLAFTGYGYYCFKKVQKQFLSDYVP